MNKVLDETDENARVIKYFQSLGYKMDWDFRGTETWHEIILDNKLVCQIDTGVPLEDIIQDFECLYLNIEMRSNSNYQINAFKDDTNFEQLLKKVYENNQSVRCGANEKSGSRFLGN